MAALGVQRTIGVQFRWSDEFGDTRVISTFRRGQASNTLGLRDATTSSLFDEWVSASFDEATARAFWPALLPELRSLAVPVYGSPPSSWTSLQKLLTTTPTIASVGFFAETNRPVLAIITPAAHFLLWMGQPIARVARRSLAERAARTLGTTVEPGDLS